MAGIKRKHSNENSDYPENSNFPAASFDNDDQDFLPNHLSDWDRDSLQKLRIFPKYEPDTTPGQLLERTLYHKNTAKCRAHRLSQFISDNCMALQTLNDRFMDINLQKVGVLTSRKAFAWNIDVPAEDLEWCNRFGYRGEDFAYMLYKTLKKRDRLPVSEYDLEFVFDAFTSMFGLRSSFAPCIENKTKVIRNQTVVGCPDLVYSCETGNRVQHGETGVIAVCKVKKNFTTDGHHTVSATQSINGSCNSSYARDSWLNHIPDSLLAQHCGELLLYYDNSMFQESVFGMIIQETKVTFTCLKMSRQHHKAIQEGSRTDETAVLTVTKSYDYMKKEERNYMIEPLIRLGLIQEYGKIC